MNTATKQATAIFRKKGGILRTHEAIQAGIHPRTLYAMRDTAAVDKAAGVCSSLQGFPR